MMLNSGSDRTQAANGCGETIVRRRVVSLQADGTPYCVSSVFWSWDGSEVAFFRGSQ